MRPLFLVAIIWHSLTTVWAQTSLPILPEVAHAIEAGTRTYTGVPGPRYFQNHADYQIEATLDATLRQITGHAVIRYHNASPTSLDTLVLRTYQDIYRPDAVREDKIPSREETPGMQIRTLAVRGEAVTLTGTGSPVSRRGTNLYLNLGQPLAPGDSLELTVDWSFAITSGGQIRMGTYARNAYFIAYWYPQVAVYDDLYGWDTLQYRGMTEFYNDVGNFELAITAPDSFLIWSTGAWQNADEILSPVYLRRWKTALTTDSVVNIVTMGDYQTQAAITRPAPAHTWRFVAQGVPDVAFAACENYLWDATSVEVEPGRRVLTEACYKASSKDFYSVCAFSRDILRDLSVRSPGIAYPYPKMTIFNGESLGGGGMEYPMMVNDGASFSLAYAFSLTHHEIAHTYFPFYMGINERRFSFMDEGWASFFPEDLMVARGYADEPMVENAEGYAGFAASGNEKPLMTEAWTLDYGTYLSNSYYKPAVAYYLLRDLLGDSLFQVALHTYMSRWHGKHPSPYDFFYSFDAGAGQNLAWYWKPWFFETYTPDLAIGKVTRTGKTYYIEVINKTGLPLPVHLSLNTRAGTASEIRQTAAVWKDGATTISLTATVPKGKIRDIRLGRVWIPDVAPYDNVYRMTN